jgi:hypothetical protein
MFTLPAQLSPWIVAGYTCTSTLSGALITCCTPDDTFAARDNVFRAVQIFYNLLWEQRSSHYTFATIFFGNKGAPTAGQRGV